MTQLHRCGQILPLRLEYQKSESRYHDNTLYRIDIHSATALKREYPKRDTKANHGIVTPKNSERMKEQQDENANECKWDRTKMRINEVPGTE